MFDYIGSLVVSFKRILFVKVKLQSVYHVLILSPIIFPIYIK